MHVSETCTGRRLPDSKVQLTRGRAPIPCRMACTEPASEDGGRGEAEGAAVAAAAASRVCGTPAMTASDNMRAASKDAST